MNDKQSIQLLLLLCALLASSSFRRRRGPSPPASYFFFKLFGCFHHHPHSAVSFGPRFSGARLGSKHTQLVCSHGLCIVSAVWLRVLDVDVFQSWFDATVPESSVSAVHLPACTSFNAGSRTWLPSCLASPSSFRPPLLPLLSPPLLLSLPPSLPPPSS